MTLWMSKGLALPSRSDVKAIGGRRRSSPRVRSLKSYFNAALIGAAFLSAADRNVGWARREQRGQAEGPQPGLRRRKIGDPLQRRQARHEPGLAAEGAGEALEGSAPCGAAGAGES